MILSTVQPDASSKHALPHLLSEDSFMQALAEGGFQMGKMATMRYPCGIKAKAPEILGAMRGVVRATPLCIGGVAKYVSH